MDVAKIGGHGCVRAGPHQPAQRAPQHQSSPRWRAPGARASTAGPPDRDAFIPERLFSDNTAAGAGLDPGREIDARARPALDLLAPPDQPAAVARVAASLARAHFLEDVVPKLASGGSHASL